MSWAECIVWVSLIWATALSLVVIYINNVNSGG